MALSHTSRLRSCGAYELPVGARDFPTTLQTCSSTRPTGSQAHSTNTYTTVATFSPDSGGTLAVTEHGIFSANAAGTLWDRTKFTAVNVVASSDSLQSTYTLTLPSGG